jgi:HEXXH motif-containing protein
LIIRNGAAHLLTELHDELTRKTLALWNARSVREYDHYVPWMSNLPDTADAVVHHPALLDHYQPGTLVHAPRLLHNINEYLRLPQAARIAKDIIKNLPPEDAGEPLVREEVSESLVERFAAARAALFRAHPLFETLFDRLVHAVVPLRRWELRMNESMDLARGVLFMSFYEPPDLWEDETDLAHELGHQALMLLNSADPLFISDVTAPVYSGVRLVDRPAIQSLHAATALAFTILFLGGRKEPQARELTAQLAQQLRRTSEALRDNCVMTPLGQTILDDYDQLCVSYGN